MPSYRGTCYSLFSLIDICPSFLLLSFGCNTLTRKYQLGEGPMQSSGDDSSLPARAVLFDIGGVCVDSPLQAIADHEQKNDIPAGWINFSISRGAPNGAWQRLERGETRLNDDFFENFTRDLSSAEAWNEFWRRRKGVDPKSNGEGNDAQSRHREKSGVSDFPAIPIIDGELLFWSMMLVSRRYNPSMYAALKKLKADGRFLLAALSNTVTFPAGSNARLRKSLDGMEWPQLGPRDVDIERNNIQELFDVFVSSAHVGMRKPQPEIYHLALDRMRRKLPDLKSGEVVFLDDIGENCKAARMIGMRTIKVSLGKTREAVEQLSKVLGLSELNETVAKI